ncbi:hypothetical protein THOM_0007 [Trachipleistophora hominis]|uniref:Uncharacterized protein n=1 Tax=Trachipleistophora hominis TaxID=72359 RepID=L7K039_TRAHO|nr:hypothetical protein THOM_0007 [Trachipleistophora hominis]
MLILKDGLLYFSKHQMLLTYNLDFTTATKNENELSELEKVRNELYGDEKYLVKIDEYEYPSSITALISYKNRLVVGTAAGKLFFDRKQVLSVDASISALFFNDPFLIIATSAGLIQIYNNKRICFQYWHRSPINQIAFTNLIYLHDGNNRLVVIDPVLSLSGSKPCLGDSDTSNDEALTDKTRRTASGQKKNEELFDNLNMPFHFHNKYLFISDDNILYAKTVNNFSSLLKLEEKVVDFTFSTNGGILFLLEESKIKIVDFCEQEVIREIRIYRCDAGRILYHNNSLLYGKDKLNVVKDVLDSVEQAKKMKEIILQENRFYVHRKVENVCSSSEDEELKDLFAQRKGRESEKLNESVDYEPSADGEYDEQHGVSTAEISKQAEAVREDVVWTPGRVQENDIILLCYNETGFLLCKQDVSVNLIELVFHDHMISNKIIHCKLKNDKGCFDANGVLLSTTTTLTYYEDTKKWELDISTVVGFKGKKIKFLGISGYLYVVVENTTYDSLVVLCKEGRIRDVYDIPRASTFVVKHGVILVLSKNQLFVYSDGQVKAIELIGAINFLGIDAQRQIYYANAEYIYRLENSMSKRVLKYTNKTVLCYYDNMFIVLNKLFPVPDVEYLRVEEKSNDEIRQEPETTNSNCTGEPWSISKCAKTYQKV